MWLWCILRGSAGGHLHLSWPSASGFSLAIFLLADSRAVQNLSFHGKYLKSLTAGHIMDCTRIFQAAIFMKVRNTWNELVQKGKSHAVDKHQ